jgi:hypothetical protein
MRVHLKLPEGGETAVNLHMIPKAGENIDFAGCRYVIASVIHAVEASKTILELLRVSAEEGFRTIKFNDLVRYRTSDIRSYSPARTRY